MTVIILEKATEKLRGTLTRWMIETKAGVFVGSVNAMVRDKLWEKVGKNIHQGALMIYSTNNEQGFSVKMLGEPSRTVIDLDGIQLIKIT